jgi:hypothetical protein
VQDLWFILLTAGFFAAAAALASAYGRIVDAADGAGGAPDDAGAEQ